MQEQSDEGAGENQAPFVPDYETSVLMWKGQALTLRWCAQWFADVTAHLVIETEDRRPHPISQTGYRSHFVHREVVEGAGGPQAFVRAWLEEVDGGDTRQLSLF
jgi:hypothetical protein